MAILGAVKGLVVVGANGGIDVDATMAKVKAALLQEIEQSAVRNQEIESTLIDVFAQLNTDKYPTPMVVAMASALLAGSNLTAIADISEEVKGYLETSPRFKGERGRNGGLRKLY
jgi:hypothetical protein